MKTPRSRRPKQGKKPTTRKKERERKEEKKEMALELGHQVNN
jgi:hypothetical protein